jgi:hypothetical protein
MKRTTLAICFTMVCSLALVLYAQAPPPGQSPSEGKGSMTLTGCLKAGSEPDTFILSNVSGGGTEAAAQRTAPGELARTDVSYKLTADSNVKLKDHVGHKVEVTGTIGKGMTNTPPSSADKPGADMAKLKVTSIKHVSPSCP